VKVEFVIYGDLNQRSGGYLYDRQLVDFLQGEGDQIDVVSLPRRTYTASLLNNLPSSAYHADLILQDELCHPSLVWSNRRIESLRIVALVHHLRCNEQWPLWKSVAYRFVEKQYLKTVHGVICTSQRTYSQLKKLMGKDIPNVVAYPGRNHMRPQFDEDDLRYRTKSLPPLRLIFVGNLIPRKGLHTLLTALSGLKHENWLLTVIGSAAMDPQYAASMKKQVHQYQLTGRVSFAGELDHGQVAEHLRSSHVLAVPSQHEGFGIAYLEGMGFGLPAIASNSGGACDFVEDNLNGFLVPPNDCRVIRRHLTKLIEQPQSLVDMGREALNTYARHPTWEMTGHRVREFLFETWKDNAKGGTS
jgi:glycosyltransferase involved in cell wall biosynthesis